MNGDILETVDKFKYLGATLTRDGKSENEINNKIGDRKFGSGKPKYNMKIRSISLRTKIHVYKYLILSIILYSCETWTLNGTLEKRINAFESKLYYLYIKES